MTIKVGDTLPAGTLSEFIEVEGNGCSVGPNAFKVEDLTRGKKVVIFGLPGAFTPTCSAKHVPSYLANYDSADYTKALGLVFDLTGKGMGVRCQRFSMLVDNGVVKALNIEAPGKYEVSGGDTMLTQLG